MEKPPDDPASATKPHPKITINAGEIAEDPQRIATAEDYRRAWEEAGRPRTLGGLFEIIKASQADPDWAAKNPQLVLEAKSSLEELHNAMRPEIESRLYASLFSAKEFEKFSIPARLASEFQLRAKEAQALAQEIAGSWRAVGDSTLKMMREDLGLLTGLLGKAGAFAAPDFEPPPELTRKWMAEAEALVTGPARMSLALESAYGLGSRQLLTESLSQSAIQYIRQTTPRLAKRQTLPVATGTREPAPRMEEARAGEKPVSPRAGEELVDTAAKALALLDADLREQTAIVRTPDEWEMLKQFMAQGKTKEISRWLSKSAEQAMRFVKQKLGMRRGRHPKAEKETQGWKCALSVAAALPKFAQAFKDKTDIQRKYRRNRGLRESALAEKGYSNQEIALILDSKAPLAAACDWVSKTLKPHRSFETVQNYWSRFHDLIPDAGGYPQAAWGLGTRIHHMKNLPVSL